MHKNKGSKFGLEFHSVCGESDYLGISWGNVNDDETGKQFKERVEKAITEVVGKKVECSTHAKAWRDG